MAAMKTVLSRIIVAMVVLYKDLSIFLPSTTPSNDDDDDDDDNNSTMRERCGTNDDGNFFKLYKARHTILHCICHEKTLSHEYVEKIENL